MGKYIIISILNFLIVIIFCVNYWVLKYKMESLELKYNSLYEFVIGLDTFVKNKINNDLGLKK